MAETGIVKDPFRSYNFLVEIDGLTQASFQECSGLDATTEPIDYREGGDNTTVRKLPGRTSYSEITLKRGMSDSVELWDWFKQIRDGTVTRKNGSIVVYDLANASEVARWNFVRAWPTKWEGPSFNATGNEIAVETLTLAHEGVDRV